MSPEKARVQKILEINFGINKVKHTNEGFKVNTDIMCSDQIKALANVYPVCEDLEIKRSGTGLVLLVTVKPEEEKREVNLNTDKVYEAIDDQFKTMILELNKFSDNHDKAARWIQFEEIEVKRHSGRLQIEFVFRSSQINYRFKCFYSEPLRPDTPDDVMIPFYFGDYKDKYERFKAIKYSIIGNQKRVDKSEIQ